MIKFLLVVLIFSCSFTHSSQEKREESPAQFWKANSNIQSEKNDKQNISTHGPKDNCSNEDLQDVSENETDSKEMNLERLQTNHSKVSNCSRCIMREGTKALRIEAIKTQILSKLKIKTAPNFTTVRPLPKVSILHQIIDQNSQMPKDSPTGPYEDQLKEDDEYHASTEKVLLFSSDVPFRLNLSHELQRHIIYFKFTRKMTYHKVVKANIWLYIRPSKQETTMILNISKISSVITSFNSTPKLTISKLMVHKLGPVKGHGYWVDFEIKKVVSQWLRHPKENYGILVQVMTHDGKNLVVNNPQKGEEAMRPFLELKLNEGSEKRVKRMVTLNCHDKSTEPLCCRYPLIVDFEDFGWDWIIAPKRYEAYFCSGECPFVFLQTYLHTHLVQQTNPQGSAEPCCAPAKLSAISMLYFDDNMNIYYSKVPGMVVDRCGCF